VLREAIKVAVRRGHGITAFSRLALSEELAAGTLVVIPFVPWKVRRTFSIVRIRDAALTPLAQQFLTILRARVAANSCHQRASGAATVDRPLGRHIERPGTRGADQEASCRKNSL
jgi:LysR substrate binding domain